MENERFRRDVLAQLGAEPHEAEELIAYNTSSFDRSRLRDGLTLPLEDEAFVEAWKRYADEAATEGVFPTLRGKLVQLSFPIREGISESDGYRAVARKGVDAREVEDASGLALAASETLELTLHQTWAGRVPVLRVGHRDDFVALVRALTARNEPQHVPPSMGACTVAGYNNWDRVRQYRRRWEETTRPTAPEEEWPREFRRLVPKKELYQDRFIILSSGPYSGVSADEMGMAEDEWTRTSLLIRREHECAHYFTQRVFASMQNNLLDELIADCAGIVAACGRFRAEWFLRFVGLEAFPRYRAGSRLENYRGEPPLSDGAFRVLQALVSRAAQGLERFNEEDSADIGSDEGRPRVLAALTGLTLEELASDESQTRLHDAFSEVSGLMAMGGGL